MQVDKSPYAYTWNNPIRLTDPDGMHPDWNENANWIPEVDIDTGDINYVAEEGDSTKTLSEQYGIDQAKAEKITKTKGDKKIKKGTKISGKTVAKNNNGNEVLKLDVTNKNTTDKDVAHQTLFAVRNEVVKDKLSDNPDGEGNLYDYFNNGSVHANKLIGRNFGLLMNNRVDITILGDVKLNIHIGFAFHSGKFGTSVARDRTPPGGKQRSLDFNFPYNPNSKRSGRVFTITNTSGNRNTNTLRNFLSGTNKKERGRYD